MPVKPKLSWISSGAALTKYEKWNGGRSDLKENLADQIRDGLVRTRGVVIGKVEASSPREAWKNTKKVGDDYVCDDISPGRWRASKRWAADQKEWRWRAGNFSVSVRLKPRRRVMIRKLELCETDLLKVLHLPAPPKKGGGKPDVKRWQSFYFAVIEIAQNGHLSPAHISNTSTLLEQVSERMDGHEFAHRIMKEAIEAVFQRFIEDDQIISDLRGNP